jgi:hypothetical protein
MKSTPTAAAKGVIRCETDAGVVICAPAAAAIHVNFATRHDALRQSVRKIKNEKET